MLTYEMSLEWSNRWNRRIMRQSHGKHTVTDVVVTAEDFYVVRKRGRLLPSQGHTALTLLQLPPNRSLPPSV